MNTSKFAWLAAITLLAGCNESEQSAVTTTENFARFGCEGEGSADNAAKHINGFASRFDATAETHDITVGDPGKVVVVQRGAAGSGGVQLIFVYKENSKTVEAFGTKAEPPNADDRTFISSILNGAPVRYCKPVEV